MNRTVGPLHPLAAIAVALLALPLLALVVAAPWSTLPSRLFDERVIGAMTLSIVAASVATGLVARVGVPLGWVLARDERWAWLRPIVLVPMVLPPVVGGVALQLP